jgi:hypothetical protein
LLMTPRAGKAFRTSAAAEDLAVRHRQSAGIDVHAAVHFVSVAPEEVPTGFVNADVQLPVGVRKFGTNTGDLLELAAWLKTCHVQTVAMESTGVYWIPLYDLLASQGFEVLLVDPRQTKHAPGRPKSDVLDCQWISAAAQLRPVDRVVSAGRRDRTLAWLSTAARDADPLRGHAHSASAKDTGRDECEVDGGGERRRRSDGSGDHQGHRARRA